MVTPTVKPLIWLGSSLRDIKSFPAAVMREIGYALFQAQSGSKAHSAKPLKGFGGAGVLEIVAAYQTDTYRAVYTVRLGERLYVLHAFQKKSKRGIATPQTELAVIKARLKQAEEIDRAWQQKQPAK